MERGERRIEPRPAARFEPMPARWRTRRAPCARRPRIDVILLLTSECHVGVFERRPVLFSGLLVAAAHRGIFDAYELAHAPLVLQLPDVPNLTTESTGTAVLPISVTLPELGKGLEPGSLGNGFADGEYLPLTKVMPRYPVPAQRAGIQGYAVVEYTVTTAGTTRDIRLVESSNPIFDRSCVEAAEKFRYRPRFVTGEAIEVPGVRNRCVYRLDE